MSEAGLEEYLSWTT